MSRPIPLFFNLGSQEMLTLFFGRCAFPGIAVATGVILTYFLMRQSKSKNEE
jgi:hypothetical protein